MLPAWLVISFWFLEDLVMMILTTLGGGRGGGVAFAAHVGGTLFGMGLMAIEKVRLKRAGDVEDAVEETVPAVRPVVRMRIRTPAVPAEVETPTIHLFSGGAEYGPFTPARIQQMFASGEIPTDAQYWQEGMDEWRTADELREPGVV
jgi:hypothetical protein